MPFDPNKYRLIIDKIVKILQAKADELIANNASESEFVKEITKMLNSNNIADELKKRFAGDAEEIKKLVLERLKKNFDFIDSKTAKIDSKEADKLISETNDVFDRIGDDIREKVIKAVKTAFTENRSINEVAQMIKNATKLSASHAWTNANTSIAAIDRLSTIKLADEAGFKYYKYVGGTPQRKFCADHINQIFSKSEIENMSNGQGLTVLTHGGGYNCTHWWMPVKNK